MTTAAARTAAALETVMNHARPNITPMTWESDPVAAVSRDRAVLGFFLAGVALLTVIGLCFAG